MTCPRCELTINQHRRERLEVGSTNAQAFGANDIRDLHRSLAEYAATPLLSVPFLAEHLGVGRILIKDESHRFGLKAFKALGHRMPSIAGCATA